MSWYDLTLGGLSLMVVATIVFLIITHYSGRYFGKNNQIAKQVKANEVFLIGFATFTTISIMLGLFGLFYCVREFYA